MGMNDYAREEKMQKIFDDRENIEEEEDEVKQENKREKDKTVMNNHNDNNNSNHHEEKVSQHVIVFLFSFSRIVDKIGIGNVFRHLRSCIL